jgi:hypothetical protein
MLMSRFFGFFNREDKYDTMNQIIKYMRFDMSLYVRFIIMFLFPRFVIFVESPFLRYIIKRV